VSFCIKERINFFFPFVYVYYKICNIKAYIISVFLRLFSRSLLLLALSNVASVTRSRHGLYRAPVFESGISSGLLQLVADLSPPRPGFQPETVRVGFVVDTVALLRYHLGNEQQAAVQRHGVSPSTWGATTTKFTGYLRAAILANSRNGELITSEYVPMDNRHRKARLRHKPITEELCEGCAEGSANDLSLSLCAFARLIHVKCAYSVTRTDRVSQFVRLWQGNKALVFVQWNSAVHKADLQRTTWVWEATTPRTQWVQSVVYRTWFWNHSRLTSPAYWSASRSKRSYVFVFWN
jgi:hypothetical protein